MRTDALFYRLFQEVPACYFESIGADAKTAEEYTFTSEELKQAGLRIDGVFKPKVEGRPIHFVEVYSYPSPNAYSNLFAKVFLWLEMKNPTQDWHASLFFASRKLDVADPQPYRNLIGSDQVSRVYLDDLPEEGERQCGLALLSMITSTPEQAFANAMRLLHRVASGAVEVDRRRVVELIEVIIAGHYPDVGRKELAKMLQIKDFHETKVFKEVREEGLEQGLKQGLEQGSVQTREEIAQRLLERKHPVKDVVSLTGLPAKQVEKLRKKLNRRDA